MTTNEDLQAMTGRTAIDADGAKIGKIGQIYVDDQTGQPLWATISTGLFGSKESFAPLYGSSTSGENLQLAVSKDMIKDAPSIDPDGHISDSENDALYTYYSGHLGDSAQRTGGDYAGGQYETTGTEGQYGTTGREDLAGQSGVEGQDTSGPTTDDAMTRSEERLRVGTEQVQAGRARLRKYVVTEQVTQTVPVSHEEVRLEREPITDANRDDAMSGADITEEEHEVTLQAERPVVQKEAVPVERVRLGTETVTEEQEVSETLRKEQIDSPDTDLTDGTDSPRQ
jgi:uncharacterized protein (TIGR02271 family)